MSVEDIVVVTDVGFHCAIRLCGPESIANGGTDHFWLYASLSLDIFMITSFLYVFFFATKESIQFTLGMMGNLFITVVLKYIIGWERLYPDCIKDPSMPSGHSQCAFFAALYFTHFYNTDRAQLKINKTLQTIRITGVWIWAFCVAYSRVFLGYHRVSEIFVGFFLGISFGYYYCNYAKPLVYKHLMELLNSNPAFQNLIPVNVYLHEVEAEIGRATGYITGYSPSSGTSLDSVV